MTSDALESPAALQMVWRILLHLGLLSSLPVPLQSGDKRVLIAAAEVVRKGLAKITLLGNPETIQAQAAKLGVDISGCQIVDHLVGGLHCTAQAHAVELSGEVFSDGCTGCAPT